MKEIEFDEKHVKRLANTIRFFLEEKQGVKDSLNFVTDFTIVVCFFMLVSLGVTINKETFKYGLLFLTANSFGLSWGIKNFLMLDKRYKENDAAMRKVLNEKHEYVSRHVIHLANQKIAAEREVQEAKEEREKLKNTIYNISTINPALFLEWINLAYYLSEKDLNLLNKVIKNLYQVFEGNFEVSDEYISLNGKLFSISGIILKFSKKGREYQEYCQAHNIKIVPLYTQVQRENPNDNYPFIKQTLIQEYLNLVDYCHKQENLNLFLTSLMLNLQRAYQEDYQSITSMYTLINNKMYAISDLVIYFSPNGDKFQEYWQVKENERLSHIYPQKLTKRK